MPKTQVPHPIRLLAVTGTAVAVWGCGSGESGQVPDGGSILPVWAVAGTPEFTSQGGAIGGDSLTFFRVRHGMFAGNGDVVVTLAGDRQIVFLDDSGDIAAVLGGMGAGPGEFQVLSGLYPMGERLAVWDERNRRMSFFRNRAQVGESPVDPPPGHRVLGLFSDGTIVTTPQFGYRAATVANLSGGRAAPFVFEGETRPYHLWSEDGEELGVLRGDVEPPIASLLLLIPRDGREVFSNYSLASSCLPEPRQVVIDDRILIADSEEGVLSFLSQSGTETVRPHGIQRDRITAAFVEDIQRWIERTEREMGRATSESKRSILDRLGRPGDPLPSVWSAMFTDRTGQVWLRRAWCSLSLSRPPETWDIADSGGSLAASMTLPVGMRLLAADGDRVLAIVTDELGTRTSARAASASARASQRTTS